MAHSPRGWTGARTPSAIKRVRQTERRRAVNQPRRTEAKTLISKAIVSATEAVGNGGTNEEVRDAVERAVSALDRAAKLGVIHHNAADRRKSRLMLKVNATLGGDGLVAGPKAARQTSKLAAAKVAKARIAASRATKAKGAQTAAGKARAALARTTRDTSSEKTAPAAAEPKAASKPAASAKAKTASKSASKSSATKSATSKSSAKTSPKTSTKTSSKAAKKS